MIHESNLTNQALMAMQTYKNMNNLRRMFSKCTQQSVQVSNIKSTIEWGNNVPLQIIKPLLTQPVQNTSIS